MSASTADSLAELHQRAAKRLAAIDPLLPAAELPGALSSPSEDCGLIFAATGSDGVVSAVGQCIHRVNDAESMNLTWGRARTFTLRPVVAGPEVSASLDHLLGQWCDHLAKVAEIDDDDSAAVVRWPSRDIEGIGALQRHGLAAQSIVAARLTPGGADEPAGGAAGGAAGPGGADVRVRRAGPADADVVTELNLGLVRYEAYFGNLHLRPWTERALHKEASEMLAKPEPWAWLAERGETAVGLLGATRPEGASWLAPLVRRAPAAYLGEMFVQPAERGSGVAALLTSHFNDAARAAGVAVTLLHYGAVNPLSVPFWSRQGYRPLWASWEARPARTLR